LVRWEIFHVADHSWSSRVTTYHTRSPLCLHLYNKKYPTSPLSRFLDLAWKL
jgi:hypothetical protein